MLAIILAFPCAAKSGDLDNLSDALDNLSDMARAADRAQEAMKDAAEGREIYRDRYYRNSDKERDRQYEMARRCGVSRSRIRALREDGLSWGEIARKYDLDDYHYRRRHDMGWHGHKKHYNDDDDD